MKELIRNIQANLSDDLLKPSYRGHWHPLYGHCYVASETFYHLAGKEAGFRPFFVRHEGSPHWFLKNCHGEIIDITAGQFITAVPYADGRGKGFLTKQPSKRAQKLMERIQ